MSDRVADIKARHSIESVLASHDVEVKGGKARCPFHEDKNPSFSITADKWKCFAGCGGGDVVELLAKFEGKTSGEYLKNGNATISDAQSKRPIANPRASKNEKPVNIDLLACVDAFPDDQVSKLAAWRGLSVEFVLWLKSRGQVGLYLGKLALPEHDPATGTLTGVHYLIGKPEDKKWIRIKGTPAQPLIIGDRRAKIWLVFESPWDAFAVMESLDYHLDGYEPSYAVLVTRGADNGKFAGIVPAEAEAIIVMQNDEEKNGKVASDDWLETIKADCPARLKVARPPSDVKDCNDWLKRGDADFNRMITEAENVKWCGLSCRSPAELLAMQFDDGDKILGDRLLAEGSSLSILGSGGIGKSRMLMQLAACQILGLPFLNFPTHGTPKRWLIIQTENSNRRLRFDLERLKAWCGSRWSEVEPLLFFHTVESEEDSLLQIEDPEALARLEALIRRIGPDVVAFDPLNAFSTDDLNKDVVMKSVLTALGTIARRGNPRRALILIHHALTGKVGKAKAMGHDRASFGRNSKVLFAWTRAQINVVATREDSNDQLVFACGKNNDGAEFQPFAAVLGHDMIYAPDSTFDVSAWQEEIGSSTAKSAEPTCKPETVAEMLTAAPLAKGELVKALREESGCGKSRAYEVIDQAQTRRLIRFDRITRRLHAT